MEMEKYFAQANPEGGMKAEHILELNASHPVLALLKEAFASDKDVAADGFNLFTVQFMQDLHDKIIHFVSKIKDLVPLGFEYREKNQARAAQNAGK